MSDQSFDFPQDELPVDETPKTVKPEKKPHRPRGKPILGKLLFFIFIVILIIAGFAFVQQTLLDLEAQAQIYAVQTAAAIASPSKMSSTPLPPTLASFPATEIVPTLDFTSTPQPPTPTATPNPDIMHTATIAAQLTLAAN
jgi:hypothetical protein